MVRSRARLLVACLPIVCGMTRSEGAQGIPRPEHPRPEAARPHWANLNGTWEFGFDSMNVGLEENRQAPGGPGFDRKIVVPFCWESELSGVHKLNGPLVGWYRRNFTVPAAFPKGQRVWLRFEAVDWRADVWVNGKKVAEHEGGYSPFSADVTDALKPEGENLLVVRAFDPTDPMLPTGKQVGWYTPTSGIWQTVWLESRPKAHIKDFVIKTEINPAKAIIEVEVVGLGEGVHKISVKPDDPSIPPVEARVETTPGSNSDKARLELKVDKPKLWTPETPELYDVNLELRTADGSVDSTRTYFGLRTIARGKFGDAPYERLLLNGKPIYLRAALDQSFNPKGIHTAPDDDFLKRDMIIAKAHGLNGLRIHIKPDEPRRLYWADKFGLLILEDMPNTWEQSPKSRSAWESTMREVVARDRNHPSIVAWVAFNETWGLGKPEAYKKDVDTQAWVRSMVSVIRSLDPTRLVEDNSPCHYDHVEGSDLNSWHFYIDDHAEARRHIEEVVKRTVPGGEFNFCPGQKQSTAPLINSEYGAVSAGGGDRDISWGFRDLTTQLRRHPKIQGYIYTELSDIEWEHNGFVNYDRSPKTFGYDAFLPDMRPNELQGEDFIGYDAPPVIVGKPGETIKVPVFLSHFSDRSFAPRIRWWLDGFNDDGDSMMVSPPRTIPATWRPYDVSEQEPIEVKLPDRPFVGALMLTIRDPENHRFAGNYVNVVVKPEKPLPRLGRSKDDPRDVVFRFSPSEVSSRQWSAEAPSRPGKIQGRGAGYLEYKIVVPPIVLRAGLESFHLRFEAASKADREKVDWPSRVNKQDYPQTDTREHSSDIVITLNGKIVHKDELADDAADARGVLSHLNRLDHGSHGDVVEAAGDLPEAVKAELLEGRPLTIRVEVPKDAKHPGGLCIFGSETGQYPFDPTLIIHVSEPLPVNLGVNPDAPVTTKPESERVARAETR